MVHALREAWRVLGSNGTLIDMRPLSTMFPIDAIGAHGELRVGYGDAAATIDDERAAEAGVACAVQEGWLVPREEKRFDLFFYWNTTADMAEYMRSGRTVKRVTPSYEQIDATLKRLARGHDEGPRLRATRPMVLGSYYKGPGN